jgi:hypothetical protein
LSVIYRYRLNLIENQGEKPMQDDGNEVKPSQEILDPQPLPGMNNANPPADPADRLKMFTTPLSQRGWPIWLIYVAAVVGLIYVLNPTMGIFEFIPDNLPLIGNLDEGVAFLLVWFGIVEYLQGRKGQAGK